MSNNKHTELVDHIRQSLLEHEEPYSPGAWESFQQQNSRKNGISVQKVTLGIAASLLFLLSLLFVADNYEFTSPETPLAGYEQQGKNEPPSISGSTEDEREQHSSEPEPVTDSQPEEVQDEFPPIQEDIKPNNEAVAALKATSSPDPPEGFRELSPVLINGKVPPGSGDLQLVAAQSAGDVYSRFGPVQQNAPVRRVGEGQGPQGKSIRFGLAYAPLFNRNNKSIEWSMGGGFYTEWTFARDLALSSGVLIAQNQLEFDQENEMRTVGTEQISSAYLQVDLLSMEIPLSLQYSLTDNLSISAGISSAAFLREEYDYNYEIQREIQVMTFTENTGYELETTTVTVLESEHQSEESFNAIDWAGFYTFSVSYKHDLSDKHSLALEPFMKLPSGHLTSRDLKYYTGGLQMKVSF